MKINKIYTFKIHQKKTPVNITILKTLNGEEHILKGVSDKNIGDSIELIVTNKKGTKYFFSQQFSNNKKYEFGKLYTLEVIESNNSFITLLSNDQVFKIKNNNYKTSNIKKGDFVLCKSKYIINNDVEFFIIGYDYEKQFNVNEYFSVSVKNIEEHDSNITLSYVHLDLGIETLKLPSPGWLLHIPMLPSIEIKYLNNRKWQINFDKIECPLYRIGQDYKIHLIEKTGNGFCLAETSDGIKIRVLEPFKQKLKNVEGLSFKYHYGGIDNSGFLEFRQRIEFKDVIESKALKVIAFDNIRKEYTNTEHYKKLFGDYDSKNNLWVLSYGNSLQEVVDDKIRSKEWDSAYLLLEVLEKIENWILNSGYLNSFSPEKKDRIIQSAEIILSKVKVLNIAISTLIDENFTKVYDNLENLYKNFEENFYEISLNIDAISRVFYINNTFFPKDLFKLLQLIKENNNEQIKKKNDERAFSNLSYMIYNHVYDKKQYNIYKSVFINPVKRRKYFNQNEGVKTCILFIIWLISVDDENKNIYYLQLLRHFAYFTDDMDEQDTLINLGIDCVYSPKIEITYNFQDFNLNNDDINKVKNHFLNKKVVFNLPYKIKRFQNNFGYISYIDKNRIIIPYNKTNLDENNLGNNINVITLDKSKKVGIGSYYIDYTPSLSNNLIEGEMVKGIIKNIVEYGIFIHLGENKDGLLHATKVSHNAISSLYKIFNIGDEITTKILRISDEGIELDRISILNEKADSIKYNKGDIVEGIIYKIDNKYGVYTELSNGAKGYIPVKEFFFNGSNLNLELFVEEGEKIRGTVIQYDKNKGYRISVKKAYENNLKVGDTFSANIIALYDFKKQVSRRLKIPLEDIKTNYCPKCQSKNYSKSVSEDSFLEFYSNNKKWRCQYCNYKSQERLVLRLKNQPVIVNYLIEGNENLTNLEYLLGKEVEVTIEEISTDNYIKAEIVSDTESREIKKKPSVSIQACIEIGYLYEQLAAIAEGEKEDLINMCRYFFGFAKSARSYFHTSLNDYNNYVNSLNKVSIDRIIDMSKQAKSLIKGINSEEAIINFPVLEYLLDTLSILSTIDKGIEDLEELINLSNEKNDNIELLEIIKLTIALRTVPNQHIKSDIWEDLKSSLINNLRLIQKDELDKESILLRRLISNIIKNDLESDAIECKGSYLIPIPNKKQLKRINDLEKQLSVLSEEEKIKSIEVEINRLKNPEVNKKTKDIVTLSWVKTIAAFANSKGGELFIGIGEDKDGKLELLGIDKDLGHFKSEDNLLLNFDNQFANYIGNKHQWLINTKIVTMSNDCKVFYIKVKESPKPVIVKKGNEEIFYIRREASTSQLTLSEYTEYINVRFFNNSKEV